jgi:hypothetical protein
LRRVVFALVVALSVIVLFAPGSDVPAAPAGTDKLVHFALFAALGASAWWAGFPVPLLVPLLLGYAGASELLQTIPALHRDGSGWDFLTDAVGLAAGLAAPFVLAQITRLAGRRWR